jgi:hypothetical protein
MTDTEMHAIEKAALDDPFLADAIDGMREAFTTYGVTSVTAQLNELNQQLSDRSTDRTEAKPILIQWWKYAAAAVVIITVGALAYNSFFTTEADKELIARTEKTDPFDKAAAQRSSPDTVREEQATADLATTQALEADSPKKSPSASREKLPPAVPGDQPQAAQALEGTTKEAQKREELKEQQETALAKKTEPALDETIVSGYARKRTENVSLVKKPEDAHSQLTDSNTPINQFSGFVTNRNNQPIPNATIRYNRNQNAFATDQHGAFNFFNKDSVLDVQVQVPGYVEKDFVLKKNNARNNLVLDQSLVDLNKASAARKSKTKPKAGNQGQLPVELQHAVPETGWIAYENYLQENKIVPEDSLTGEVIVSFEVNASGEPKNFRVEKSPGSAYEKEAIRLISSGPRWITGNKAVLRTTVSVKF